MSDAGILDFARNAPIEYIRCREGARHSYPYVAPKDKIYVTDKLGYDVFDNECQVCHKAYRRERWLITEDRKTGTVKSMHLVDATTKYYPEDDGGTSDYLLPKGTGFVPGRLLLEAHTTLACVGGMVRRRAA